MMISKLLKEANDESVISKDEVLDILTQVTSVYAGAAKSMGAPESRLFDASPGRLVTTNSISVQACILSTVLARLREDRLPPENDMSEDNMSEDNTFGIPLDSSLTWVEDQLNRSTFSVGEMVMPQQAEHIDSEPAMFGQPHDIGSSTSKMQEGLDFVLDDDIINSRYFDAGLLSWDDPGGEPRRFEQ
ncbi:hypothetical protein ACHAPJ_013477 [Fusarium lateritium]